jgi:uncharacterized protein (DUF1697 family)
MCSFDRQDGNFVFQWIVSSGNALSGMKLTIAPGDLKARKIIAGNHGSENGMPQRNCSTKQKLAQSAMASVVFFRAVNVAGYQKCQPAKLAKELSEFDTVNIGAAGTFVVRAKVSEANLRHEILRRLSFKPALMICAAREVLALAQGDWFHDAPSEKDAGRFVSVLHKSPRTKPPLPIEQPVGRSWEVRVVAITGKFVLSLRRAGQTYSNAVVEKHFGIPATTRSWNTIQAVRKILEK